MVHSRSHSYLYPDFSVRWNKTPSKEALGHYDVLWVLGTCAYLHTVDLSPNNRWWLLGIPSRYDEELASQDVLDRDAAKSRTGQTGTGRNSRDSKPKQATWKWNTVRKLIHLHPFTPKNINFNFPCSLTRNITSHSMKNLAFCRSHSEIWWLHQVSPPHYIFLQKGSENVLFELGSEKVKEVSVWWTSCSPGPLHTSMLLS